MQPQSNGQVLQFSPEPGSQTESPQSGSHTPPKQVVANGQPQSNGQVLQFSPQAA